MDETPSQTALRERLRAVGMELFRREGLRFTMQEAARAIHISKKTIYAVYPSKLTAAQKTTLATVNALFSGILLTSDDPGRYTPAMRQQYAAVRDIAENAQDVQVNADAGNGTVEIGYTLHGERHSIQVG